MTQCGKERSPGDTILLAEDNEDDVFLIKRSFTQAGFLNPLHVTWGGVETIAYLNGDGIFADRVKYPFPALLLLDLKMPDKDGFEVLAWIRQQSHLPRVRVVALTSSNRIFDVKRAFALGAAAFLTKPLNLHHLIQLGPAVRGDWRWSGSEIPGEPAIANQGQDCGRESVESSPAYPLPDLCQTARTAAI